MTSQWVALFQRAQSEVMRCVDVGLDRWVLRLLFDPGASSGGLDEVDSSEDVASVINTVYRILAFDWIGQGKTGNLSVILHCVQNLMASMVEASVRPASKVAKIVAAGAESRTKLSEACRDLARTCQASRFRDLKGCLAATRALFVDVWCALLCVPFVPGYVMSSSSRPPTLTHVEVI